MRAIHSWADGKERKGAKLRRLPRGKVVHICVAEIVAVCGVFGATENDDGGRLCEKCEVWLRAAHLYVVGK